MQFLENANHKFSVWWSFITNIILFILLMLSIFLWMLSIYYYFFSKKRKNKNHNKENATYDDNYVNDLKSFTLLIHGKNGVGKTHWLIEHRKKITNDQIENITFRSWDYDNWDDFVQEFSFQISKLKSIRILDKIILKINSFFYNWKFLIKFSEYKFKEKILKKVLNNRNTKLPIYIYIDDLETANIEIANKIIKFITFIFDVGERAKFDSNHARIIYSANLLYFMQNSNKNKRSFYFSEKEINNLEENYNNKDKDEYYSTEDHISGIKHMPARLAKNKKYIPRVLEKYFLRYYFISDKFFGKIFSNKFKNPIIEKKFLLYFKHLSDFEYFTFDNGMGEKFLHPYYSEINERSFKNLIDAFIYSKEKLKIESNIGQFIILYNSYSNWIYDKFHHKKKHQTSILLFKRFSTKHFTQESEMNKKIEKFYDLIFNYFQINENTGYINYKSQDSINIKEIDIHFKKIEDEISEKKVQNITIDLINQCKEIYCITAECKSPEISCKKLEVENCMTRKCRFKDMKWIQARRGRRIIDEITKIKNKTKKIKDEILKSEFLKKYKIKNIFLYSYLFISEQWPSDIKNLDFRLKNEKCLHVDSDLLKYIAEIEINTLAEQIITKTEKIIEKYDSWSQNWTQPEY